MITILVVGPPRTQSDTAAYAAAHPSVELLAAAGVEEALEKLARNRRIDAVLLLPGAEAAELAATLGEEDPSAPPLFAPASKGMGAIAGVSPLREGGLASLLEEMVERLETDA